jgi:hypothetical protein
MANYVKGTNFTAKDSLPIGNAGKIVKGTEIDVELAAVAAAIASKSDSNNPTFTGTPLAPTAAAGTNNTQLATTAFVNTAVSASIPAGGIILWSGSVASIPSGWFLCNGSNGTPDLRNRFVVGAGSTYAVDATGGSADAITVSHTHTFSATTASNGAHQHNLAGNDSSGAGVGTRGWDRADAYSILLTDSPGTGVFVERTASAANTIIFSAGAHTHTVSGTTDSIGTSGTNANLPPYYALCYIMKA